MQGPSFGSSRTCASRGACGRELGSGSLQPSSHTANEKIALLSTQLIPPCQVHGHLPRHSVRLHRAGHNDLELGTWAAGTGSPTRRELGGRHPPPLSRHPSGTSSSKRERQPRSLKPCKHPGASHATTKGSEKTSKGAWPNPSSPTAKLEGSTTTWAGGRQSKAPAARA